MSQFRWHNGDQHVSTWGSAEKAVIITPSDSTILEATRGIYVGGSGNLVVTMKNGQDVTFTGVSAGMIFPISTIKVKATGTTATNLVAVY